MLAQVILISGWSSARTLLEFYPFVFKERVRTVLYFTSFAFFFIVPFVQVRRLLFYFGELPHGAAQVPLLLGALSRLNDGVR